MSQSHFIEKLTPRRSASACLLLSGGKADWKYSRLRRCSRVETCSSSVTSPLHIACMMACQVEAFRNPNLVFPITGKNDELVVPSRLREMPATGAVLGVELKKRIGPGDLYQAQAEWLLYGPQSMFPYMQVRKSAWN
jgi:hypothetical protein